MNEWLSPIPKECDLCGAPITDVFYDAKTYYGPWACVCPRCFDHKPRSMKIGTGHGQKYEKQSERNPVWLKTKG